MITKYVHRLLCTFCCVSHTRTLCNLYFYGYFNILVFSPFCWVFRYLVHFICFIWFNFDGFRLRLKIILFVRGFNLLSTSRFGTSACQRNRKRFESLALVRVWKIFSFQLLHIFMYIYITGYWWKMCEDSLADWAHSPFCLFDAKINCIADELGLDWTLFVSGSTAR